MRNLPAEFAFEKDRADAAPFTTAVFHFGGTVGDVYVSDREVTIGGNFHAGVVARWGEYRAIVAPRDGMFQVGAMSVEIVNFPAFGAPPKRFTDLWSGLGVEGVEVDVYECVRQESQDAVLQYILFAGVLRPGRYRPNVCELEIYSISEKYLDRAECSRPIDQSRYPNADPEDISKREHVIFGTVKKVRAHLVSTGQKSTVRATMTTAATTVPIQDDYYESLNTRGITSGTVQIGNEKIVWTSKSGSAGSYVLGGLTRGSGSTPIEQHNPNDTLIEVVSSWICLAAGHAMKSVDRVYVRRGDKFIPLAAAQYTANLANTALVAGETKTTITFTAPPLVAEKDYVAISASAPEASFSQSGSDETVSISPPNPWPAGNEQAVALSFPAQAKTLSSGEFTKRLSRLYVSGGVSGRNAYIRHEDGDIQITSGAANTGFDTIQMVNSNYWSLVFVYRNDGAQLSNPGTLVVNIGSKSVSYAVAVPSTLSSTSTADNPIGEIYFDGQGYADDGSGTYTGTPNALVEKPADVMHYFARVVAGIPANRVDAPAFVQARNDSPSYYKFGAVLGERSNNKTILLAMGAQAGIQPDWPADKLTVRKLKPSYGVAAKILTQEHLVRDGERSSLVMERGAVEDMQNIVAVYYGLDRSKGRSREAFTKVSKASDSASIAKYGPREQPDSLLCDFIDADNSAMADDIRDLNLVRLAEPARLPGLEAKVDNFELAPGDVVGLEVKTKLDHPQEYFDGLDGSQIFLVEQAALRPGSASGRQGTRVGLRLREVATSLTKIPVALRANVLLAAPLTANLLAYSKNNGGPLTFARATAATYIDPVSGLLVSAASGAPRFESLGLFFERAATNLLQRSLELNLSPWTTFALAAVNVNTIAGPSGVVDFETIVEDGTANPHANYQLSPTFTAGSKLSWSVDVKPGARSWLCLQISNTAFTNQVTAWFNLATGALGTLQVTGAASAQQSQIQAAANGCYRCSVSAIIDGSSTTVYAYTYLSTGDLVNNYAGNSTGSLHAGNAQLEIGAPTSRIVTAGATATRNADDLTIPEAGHLFAAAGTIVFVCAVAVIDSGVDAYQLIDAAVLAGTTGVEIVVDGNAVRARVFSGGATVANLTGGGTFTAGVAKKVGLAWQANDFRLVVDGAEVASDGSGAAPTALHGTSIFPARRSDGSRRLIGHLRDIELFDRALTSAEIAAAMASL